jgi:glycyl-tRNA synthetase beta chain
MAKDFLLEIGTEPLPARFVAPAVEQLSRGVVEGLRAARVAVPEGSARTYATLRRLAVLLPALPEMSQAKSEKVKGPPKKLLKDAAGAFTPQSAGFAKKQGVRPEDLSVEGEFIYAQVETPGRKTADILAELVPQALRAIEFPKSLEWEPTRFKFGRPIRSIAALLGDKVVPIEVAGVKAGRKVWGLPSLGDKPFTLKAPGEYLKVLEKEHVLADVERRRGVLLERLKKASSGVDLDEELVDETVYMTEQPTPVVGSFSQEFLKLPAPLLALVMKKQLKFFPVHEGRGGAAHALKASFVGVRDGLSQGEALVREGYQRVLTARGDDAVFFFNRDLAHTLESRLPQLERVMYQRGLGTVAQRAQRVQKLTAELCGLIRQDRSHVDEAAAAAAARLAFADLVTDVVKEFPELQGVMGGEYARREGLGEKVALALEQFYLPTGPKSAVPATVEGALVSLAGKLDALAGHFSIGNVPSGSADPFALRRQALGAIRIALEHQLPLSLTEALDRALALQPTQLSAEDAAKVRGQLQEFVWSRFAPFLEEKGFAVDEIRSVRRDGLTHLKRAYLRLSAVHAVRRHPDFEPLAAAFKRASNILRQAKFPADAAPLPERAGLKDEAELNLFDASGAIEGLAHDRLLDDDYEGALKALVGIKAHLDRFFDKVMVMADDAALREQRLRLLAKIVKLFYRVADLAEIQAAGA